MKPGVKKTVVALVIAVFVDISLSEAGQWTPSGPVWGSVLSLCFDPRSGSVYAGVNYGLYKTTNGGSTWTEVHYGLAIYLLVIDGSGTFYAGTSYGVYKSVDEGLTWTAVNDGRGVVALAVDPSSSAVYVGFWTSVYKTTTGGNSWTKVYDAGSSSAIEDLAVDDDGTVYLSTYAQSVLRTTDGGNNWIKVSNGLPNSTPDVLAVGNSVGTVYVGTYWDGVYKTTNGGTNWAPANNGLPDGRGVESMAVANTGEIYAVARDQAGGVGVYKSLDDGANWVNVSDSFTPSQKSQARTIIVNNSGVVYVGAGNRGMLKTTDGGASWTDVSLGEFFPVNVGRLASDHTGTVYAGLKSPWGGPDTGSLGVFKTTNGGASWVEVNNGLTMDEMMILDLAVDTAGSVYATSYSTGITKSTSGGEDWIDIRPEPVDFYEVTVGRLAVDHSTRTVYLGTLRAGVLKTTNGGANWVQTRNGLPRDLEDVRVEPMAVRNPGEIYAMVIHYFGGAEGGIYKTSNDGANWHQINNGLTSTSVSDIVVNIDGAVYAGTQGDGVFKTTDGGANWTQVSDGLSNLNVSALEVDGEGTVYAGTSGSGVFKTVDGGANWTQVSNVGLTDRNIYSFTFVRSSGVLYAGTGSGVFLQQVAPPQITYFNQQAIPLRRGHRSLPTGPDPLLEGRRRQCQPRGDL